ncbi:membrane protein [Thermococcus sp. EP1]|nr:membrane protein [Thermococcus sp. EP1]
MRVLILAIDRDNDFGEKAGVKGPVIGKEACIDAALKLSLADPEDSDANVLYAAIKLYEELKERGEFDDVEIALITGHSEVGIKSDIELNRQLAEVLEIFPAHGVIPVTDGAEDEQIFPLITSRLPIISTRRVVVKQSESIETTYYILYRYLKEIFSDPEAAKIFFGLPGMILLIYGIARLLSIKYQESVTIISSTVTGIILFLIGGYFFARAFRLKESVGHLLTKGFIQFVSAIAAVFVLFAGAVSAYLNLESIALQLTGRYPGTELLGIVIFLNAINTSFVVALAVLMIGKVVHAYLRRDHHIWYYISGLLLLPALWVTIDVTTLYALSILSFYSMEFLKRGIIALGDIALATLVGMYLRDKLRGWERVETERSTA